MIPWPRARVSRTGLGRRAPGSQATTPRSIITGPDRVHTVRDELLGRGDDRPAPLAYVKWSPGLKGPLWHKMARAPEGCRSQTGTGWLGLAVGLFRRYTEQTRTVHCLERYGFAHFGTKLAKLEEPQANKGSQRLPTWHASDDCLLVGISGSLWTGASLCGWPQPATGAAADGSDC